MRLSEKDEKLDSGIKWKRAKELGEWEKDSFAANKLMQSSSKWNQIFG